MTSKRFSKRYSLAVTGTWSGTSQEKLNTDLGLESLSSRRWSRRLTLLYKFVHESQYCLRDQDVIGRLKTRTKKFKASFYPNCLSEWNKLEPELRYAPSVAALKEKLLSIIRPLAESVFGIHDPKGLSYLTQLRVGLSKLNFHKFKHNFRDTVNPMCPTSNGIEDIEHFLLLCSRWNC